MGNDPTKQNRLGREVLGIILLGVAFFLGVALYSYNPSDPSLNVQYIGKVKAVHNLGGIVGAYGADLLIQILGAAAYLLPLGCVFVALLVLLQRGVLSIFIKALGSLVLILSISIGLGIWMEPIVIEGEKTAAGGAFGEILSASFLKYLSLFGASFFVILLLILSFVVTTGVSFSSAFRGLHALGAMLAVNFGKVFRFHREPIYQEERIGTVKKPRARQQTETIARVVEPPMEKPVKGSSLEQEEFDFVEPRGTFHLPSVSFLDSPSTDRVKVDRQGLATNSQILERKLRDYGVEGKVVGVRPGPVITVFEFEPAPGVKVSKILGLADDLALALSAVSIRIVAPIPGKAVVGVEIPNKIRETVYLKQIVTADAFKESKSKLSICLGMDISGDPFVIDLARMPHLLVAGSTGSGKSVFLNSMICSILFKATPNEVRFLLIDPKMLELSLYEGIPHLLLPVVTNPKKAALALSWLVDEMERRYAVLAPTGVRNIEQHNRQIEKQLRDLKGNGPKKNVDLLDAENNGGNDGDKGEAVDKLVKLPYIVVVIDELADLMMVSSREVEESITRLAQMARAVGIHLILATQRPSVDVITGIIKANFPARISFQVSSKTDSRTILDTIGAEHLLGSGDMLFLPPGSSKMIRVHGAFVSEIEIQKVVDFLKKQGKPEYDPSIIEDRKSKETLTEEDYDEKYDEALAFVAETGQASISLIQRRFRIGYNRAARIIERMEAEGVVGPSDGVKQREVLINKI